MLSITLHDMSVSLSVTLAACVEFVQQVARVTGETWPKCKLRTTALRRYPARGGWRFRRGADTVRLIPTSAGNRAMLHSQRVLSLCPTRNRSACPAQNA